MVYDGKDYEIIQNFAFKTELEFHHKEFIYA
jgi:hypothetical protein